MAKKPTKGRRKTDTDQSPAEDHAVDVGVWTGAGIRATEPIMAQISQFLAGQNFESFDAVNAALQTFLGDGHLPSSTPTTASEHAQALIWQAAETAPAQRVPLLRQALTLDPDCADAYTMQAELASTLPEAHDLYQAAVAAAERTLGPAIFQEDVGHFWGLVQTRPYMRARAGLGMVLWMLGEHDAAVGHYQDLLRLNPNDNQGVRYDLARWLLLLGQHAAVGALFRQYDDVSADWLYTKALWLFRTKARAKAARALRAALAANPWVPAYVLGAKTLPKTMPAYVGLGDPNEAVAYVASSWEEWNTIPGALEWLVKGMALALADAQW